MPLESEGGTPQKLGRGSLRMIPTLFEKERSIVKGRMLYLRNIHFPRRRSYNLFYFQRPCIWKMKRQDAALKAVQEQRIKHIGTWMYLKGTNIYYIFRLKTVLSI